MAKANPVSSRPDHDHPCCAKYHKKQYEDCERYYRKVYSKCSKLGFYMYGKGWIPEGRGNLYTDAVKKMKEMERAIKKLAKKACKCKNLLDEKHGPHDIGCSMRLAYEVLEVI